jgi:quercetin dioxygenase-like cupin family protein
MADGTMDMTSWPAELDAMTAAAEHHEVLLENDQVRVLESRVAPGDSTPVHNHCWPAVLFVLSNSVFFRYDDNGDVIFDSRASGRSMHTGQVGWSPPLLPHYVKNVGDNEIRVISIEIKD